MVIRNKVIAIIESNLEKIIESESVMDVDLVELGMDSISFIRVVVALEEEFDIEIPDELVLLNEMSTINKIVQIISDLKSGERQHAED